MTTWLSIQVELVAGRGEHYLPRPGRILVARRSFTFRKLAHAINVAFGRWELAHLHQFVLADGTEIVHFQWSDEVDDRAVDDDATTLSRLGLGEQFAYEFDQGQPSKPPSASASMTRQRKRATASRTASRAARGVIGGRVPLQWGRRPSPPRATGPPTRAEQGATVGTAAAVAGGRS